MTNTNTEKRIEVASTIMGKAIAKLAAEDMDLARRLSDLLCREMQAVREGR